MSNTDNKLPLETDREYANYIRSMYEELEKDNEIRYIRKMERIDRWLFRAMVVAFFIMVIAQAVILIRY